jgi:hypothetical protein
MIWQGSYAALHRLTPWRNFAARGGDVRCGVR